MAKSPQPPSIVRTGLFTAARVGLAGALLIALHNLVLVPLIGQPFAAVAIMIAMLGTVMLLDRLGVYGPRRKHVMRSSHGRVNRSSRR